MLIAPWLHKAPGIARKGKGVEMPSYSYLSQKPYMRPDVDVIPRPVEGVNVRALKVFYYRKARVHGVPVPRGLLDNVQREACRQCGASPDNHQVVVAKLDGGIGSHTVVAIFFHDGVAILGGPKDVVVEDW